MNKCDRVRMNTIIQLFNRALFVVTLFLLTELFSCAQNSNYQPRFLVKTTSVISSQEIGFIEGQRFVVDTDIDLQGKSCKIPNGVTLVFKGGKFKNGELYGQNTKIEYSGVVFDKVLIGGSWICPIIKSSMFADLRYDNSLKDVLALTNPDIHNKVIIEEGYYSIVATKPTDSCILVRNNTELIINGTIELTPNSYGKYYMIHVLGDDVIIKGKGSLIGDRPKHIGKEGQWGFGIYVNRSHRVTISDLSISECWGDCIYVNGMSSDVNIKNCKISYGRRQGISITSADNVTIKDCYISNIAGHAPEYGIDVEPNANDTVRVVRISNVVIEDCVGGIMAYGNAADAYIGNIEIKNCQMYASKKIPIRFIGCENAKAVKCTLTGSANLESILCEDVDNAKIYCNTFQFIGIMKEGKRRILRRLSNNEGKDRINLRNCGKTMICSNKMEE